MKKVTISTRRNCGTMELIIFRWRYLMHVQLWLQNIYRTHRLHIRLFRHLLISTEILLYNKTTLCWHFIILLRWCTYLSSWTRFVWNKIYPWILCVFESLWHRYELPNFLFVTRNHLACLSMSASCVEGDISFRSIYYDFELHSIMYWGIGCLASGNQLLNWCYERDLMCCFLCISSNYISNSSRIYIVEYECHSSGLEVLICNQILKLL